MVKYGDNVSYQYNLVENKIISFLVFSIGFSINISQVISGINVALSDLFLILLFGYLLYKRIFYLNNYIFSYFLMIISFRLFSTLLIGNWIPITIAVSSLVVTLIKFLISLLYLFILISIFSLDAKVKMIFLKGMMYGTILLGAISLIIFILGPKFLHAIILFGDLRLRGFMNDPNFFGYMQISGFCVWLFNRFKSKLLNLVSIITYVCTIILSASKTALLIFLVIIFVYLAYRFFTNKKSLVQVTIFIFSVVVLIGYILLEFKQIALVFTNIVNETPQLSRTMVLFDNFDTAVNSEGSGRTEAWHTAINIIKSTNYLGIGFVNYSDVANYISGARTIAHNTYLQLAVEWGVIPLLISIVIIFRKIIDKIVSKDWNILFIIGVSLVFSLSISLQNSRLLWCLLAILFFKEKRNEF